jgi:CheY-like chemotaxis protein
VRPEAELPERDKLISRIKVRVESLNRRSLELKADLDRLTTTTFSELFEVTELRDALESLRKDGDRCSSEAGQADSRARALDTELEKLLIIKRLLERTVPSLSRTAEPEHPPPPPKGEQKILVVDDDPTTVKIVTHFLEQENFAVSSSLSGVEGLKKAFRDFPDLIILDIMMPDLNGFQFLSIYREDGEGREIPVVVLSSLAEEADVLKGLDLGAVDYITKPFSPQVLVAKVKKNLGARA